LNWGVCSRRNRADSRGSQRRRNICHSMRAGVRRARGSNRGRRGKIAALQQLGSGAPLTATAKISSTSFWRQPGSVVWMWCWITWGRLRGTQSERVSAGRAPRQSLIYAGRND
jgi:hypothetical protein